MPPTNNIQAYLTKFKALFKYRLIAQGSQLIGQRESQQDRFEIIDDVQFADGRSGTLMLVADGMGGHIGGSEASQMIVDAFRQQISTKTDSIEVLFELGLAQSNQMIAAYIAKHAEFAGMGSTVVVVLVVEGALYWLSVGDSPLWLLRNGQLQRLNDDHSMLPVLIQMANIGEIELEDVHQDPKRHLLRSVVQGKPIKMKDLRLAPFALQAEDIIILASDGLQSLAEQSIGQLRVQPNVFSCKQAVMSLLKKITVLNHAEQDNTTVIVATLVAATWQTLWNKWLSKGKSQ